MAIGDNRGVRIQDYETIDIKNKSGRTMARLTLKPVLGKRGLYVLETEYDIKVAVVPNGRFDGTNR